MSVLFVLLFIGLAAAQPHHGGDLLCYPCHAGHGGFAWPECLNHVHRCHGEEVCKMRTGANGMFRCQPAPECDREVHESTRTCTTGGALVRGGCQTCCKDKACVDGVIAGARNTTAPTSNPVSVHCPWTCKLDNLASCVQKGHVCHSGQYCKVTVDEAQGLMHGECKDNHDLSHCQDEANRGHCDPGHHHCTMGCCQDDKCVAGSLGAQSTALTDFLKGNCSDQLENQQCQMLDQSQHLCGDRLAVRVCPQTCGLCSLFAGQSCHDTVADGGCANLVLSEDICKQDVAQHICPETCGLCEQKLEQQINQLLAQGGAQPPHPTQPTIVPPQPTIVPPDMGAMTCSDLANQDCDVMATICPTVNCPDVCSKCDPGAVATGAPTDAPAPMVTSAAVPVDPLVTDAPVTAAPVRPMATTGAAPVVTVGPVATSMAPPVATVGPLASTMGPPAVTVGPLATTMAPGPVVTTMAVPVTPAPVATTMAPIVTPGPVVTTMAVPVTPAPVATTMAVPVVTPGPVVTMAAPGGGLAGLGCADLVGLGCGVLDAVCSTVSCPDVCDPCFKPIVTGGPATPAPTIVVSAATNVVVDVQTGTRDVKGIATSPMPTQADPAASVAVCEDTIRDMSCGDVADVCSSPLLVNYCQKFCGLCT